MVNRISNSKYHNRIILLITTVMVLFTIIFSISIYYSIDRIVISNEHNKNEKILMQVKFNIENIDENIRYLCKYIYSSPDVKTLMYTKTSDNDIPEISISINKLNSWLSLTAPHIQSVTILNGDTGAHFSVRNGMFFVDTGLEEFVTGSDTLPMMKPVLRRVRTSENEYEDVFTYFLYDYNSFISRQGFSGGAVIVNVHSEWVLNTIKYINQVENETDLILIVDSNGAAIGNSLESDSEEQAYIKELYESTKHMNGEPVSFVERTIGNKKVMLSSVTITDAGLTILKIQDYRTIYKYIDSLRFRILSISIIFLLINVALSLVVSSNIYNPIGKLVGQVMQNQKKFASADMGNGARAKDDIGYLSDNYQDTVNKLLESERKSRIITKTHILRKLLKESLDTQEKKFELIKTEYGLEIDFNGKFLVCIARIDDIIEFQKNNSNSDIELIRFAILNITSEMMGKYFKNEAFDVDAYYMAVVVQLRPNEDDNFIEKVNEVIKKAQEVIQEYFSITLTFSISDEIGHINSLAELYRKALDNSIYRYVYGKGSIIIYDNIKINIENNGLVLPDRLESRLIEILKSGNAENVDCFLEEAKDNLSKLSYNNIILSLMHMMNAINVCVNEINKKRYEPLKINFHSLNYDFLEMETMDEFLGKISSVAKNIAEQKKNSQLDDKYKMLSQTAAAIIEAEYFDPGLCMDKIASLMKVSTKHIGKVFKEYKGTSINSYINDVRFTKALDWMKNSKLTLSEIAAKVGIENESYFYAQFKKRYGATPREYMLKLQIKSINKGENS